MSKHVPLRRTLTRVAAVIGIAISLGGCFIAPYGAGPGYYRPHRYYYY